MMVNKLSHKIGSFIIFFSVLILFAAPVLAQPAVPPGNATVFTNPLGVGVTLVVVINRVINWLLAISASLALFAIIAAGIRMIIASTMGDEKAVEAAKKIVVVSMVALALIALSFVIVRTIPAILGVTGI